MAKFLKRIFGKGLWAEIANTGKVI